MNAKPLLELAIASHDSKQWDEAKRLYLEVLELEPGNPIANCNMGRLLFELGRQKEGVSYFRAAHGAAPANRVIWRYCMDAFLAAGFATEAQRTLEMGLQQGFTGHDVVDLLARVTMQAQALNGFAPSFLPDITDEAFYEILRKAWPYSMWKLFGGVDVFYSLYQMIHHVVDQRIEGDFVECGVNAGGMSLFAALAFLQRNDFSRNLFLYDTFSGMPPPSPEDGREAEISYRINTRGGKSWAPANAADVRNLMLASGYPEEKVIIVEGLVENVIPAIAPQSISVLRLDTDFYASTKHELVHLYPRLSRGGALIIDDYGYWKGAQRATDEYFSQSRQPILLQRLNYTVRVGLKP